MKGADKQLLFECRNLFINLNQPKYLLRSGDHIFLRCFSAQGKVKNVKGQMGSLLSKLNTAFRTMFIIQSMLNSSIVLKLYQKN